MDACCLCSGDRFAVPGRLDDGVVEKERPRSVACGAEGVLQIDGKIRGDDCMRGVL